MPRAQPVVRLRLWAVALRPPGRGGFPGSRGVGPRRPAAPSGPRYGPTRPSPRPPICLPYLFAATSSAAAPGMAEPRSDSLFFVLGAPGRPGRQSRAPRGFGERRGRCPRRAKPGGRRLKLPHLGLDRPAPAVPAQSLEPESGRRAALRCAPAPAIGWHRWGEAGRWGSRFASALRGAAFDSCVALAGPSGPRFLAAPRRRPSASRGSAPRAEPVLT